MQTRSTVRPTTAPDSARRRSGPPRLRGLNLPTAEYVDLLDFLWNPSNQRRETEDCSLQTQTLLVLVLSEDHAHTKRSSARTKEGRARTSAYGYLPPAEFDAQYHTQQIGVNIPIVQPLNRTHPA